MSSPRLLDHFSALEDPRQSWKVVYPLKEVLLVVLAGVMAGADGFGEIAHRAERKLSFLRRFLSFPHGGPADREHAEPRPPQAVGAGPDEPEAG